MTPDRRAFVSPGASAFAVLNGGARLDESTMRYVTDGGRWVTAEWVHVIATRDDVHGSVAASLIRRDESKSDACQALD